MSDSYQAARWAWTLFVNENDYETVETDDDVGGSGEGNGSEISREFGGLPICYLPSWAKYILYQLELCPGTGRLHYQGYIVLQRSQRRNWLKQKLFEEFGRNEWHLEVARKGDLANERYCKKLDSRIDGPFEFGDPKRVGQGKRTELLSVQEALDGGATEHRIAKDFFAEWVKHRAAFNDYRKLQASEVSQVNYSLDQFSLPAIDWNQSLVWLVHGPTNVGKTSWVLANFKNPLVIMDVDDLRNFDPNCHDGIVFDDMSFNHWPFSGVVNLLDSDLTRTVRCRYQNATIPKGTRRVFTHNTENALIPDKLAEGQVGAILRRYKAIHVDTDIRLFTNNNNQ